MDTNTIEKITKYCEHWCGPLEKEQEKMLLFNIKKGLFLGVGRAQGRTKLMPLVLIGKTVNVIDGAGYYQLAATDGRKGYTDKY